MPAILSFDTQFTTLLASLIPHHPFFNTLFSFLSLEGNWILIWFLFSLFLILYEEKKDKKFVPYLLISMTLTFLVVNVLLKNVFQRQRPYLAQQIQAAQCPVDYSFPSTHAAGAFAGAVIVAAFDKKRRSLYYGLAFLISYSRIYLHCHYFFDVLFGALIGFILSKATLLKLTYRK